MYRPKVNKIRLKKIPLVARPVRLEKGRNGESGIEAEGEERRELKLLHGGKRANVGRREDGDKRGKTREGKKRKYSTV